MTVPLDSDYVVGTLVPVAGLTSGFSSLVDHAFAALQDTQVLDPAELARIAEFAQASPETAKSVYGVSIRMVPAIVKDYLEKDWAPVFVSKMRGVVAEVLFTNEQRLRQAFCVTVLDKILKLGSNEVRIIAEDKVTLMGELIDRDDAACVIEERDDDTMATFTYHVPTRDILCVGLSASQEQAMRVWEVVRLTHFDEDEKARLSPRDPAMHTHHCLFTEVLAADQRDNARTHFRLQLKGGTVLKGELMAASYRGILLSHEDQEDSYTFVPLEVIRVPGIETDRSEAIEIAKAKARGKGIPEHIQRKREQKLRGQLWQGHDEEFLR